MARGNVKYANITEMLLAKQQEQERAEKQRMDQTAQTMINVTVLGILFTAIILYATWQEGLWP